MPALSSPTTWRTHPHTTDGFLYIYKPTVVFACSVNQATFTYPVAQLTYDTVTVGAYTDIRVNQLVKVMDSSGNFKEWGRVRKAPTSSILYIGHVSAGEINFADNDLVEVLNDFRPQVKVPRDLANGTMYKDYDLAYSDQNSKIPPKCNAGGAVVDFIGNDGFIHVDFVLTSYALASGASIGANPYTGNIDGGTVETGSIASGTFTAKFAAGVHYCTFTVTDSNGKTGSVNVPVVSVDPTDAQLIPVAKDSIQHQIDLNSGATFDFETRKANVSKTLVIPGALVIYFENEVYGTTAGSLAGSAGRENVKFVGWLRNNTEEVEPKNDTITFSAVDIIGKMAQLEGFPQTLMNRTSPADWTQVKDISLLRFIFYLLYWHSTVLDICDLVQPTWNSAYTQTPSKLDADPGPLSQQMQVMAGYVNAPFLADRNGILHMERSPQYMSDYDRTLVTTTITLQTTDYSTARWQESHERAVYWLRGSGVIADRTSITAKLSIAPGSSPSQGGREDTLDRQLILSQTDLNIRTGRKYTLLNNDIQTLEIEVPLGGQIADVAWSELIKFNMPVTTNKRQTSFSDTYFILKNITITHEAGSNKERWTLEPLVYGVAGLTQAVPTDPPPIPPFVFPEVPISPILPTTFADSPAAYSWGFSSIGRLRQGSTNWEKLFDISDFIGGAGSSFINFYLDPWNPKNGAYVFTKLVTTGQLFVFTIDGLDGPVGSQVITPVTLPGLYGIANSWYSEPASINAEGLVVFSAYESTFWGARAVLKRNTRSSSVTQYIVSGALSTVGFSGEFVMGHHASGVASGVCYFRTISNAAPQAIRIHKSTDMGQTWAVDHTWLNTPVPNIDLPMCVPYQDNPNDAILYASGLDSASADYFVRRNADGSYSSIGISNGAGGYRSVTHIYACTLDRLKMAVIADGFLYTSLDGGDTFTLQNLPSGSITAYETTIWGYPNDTDILFLVTTGGIFYSSDLFTATPGAVTWNDFTYDHASVVGNPSAVSGVVAVWTNQ